MEKIQEDRRSILSDISSRIRHIRLQKGLSMDALAKMAGFTKSYVSQIENQKREPTIGTLVTLAHALDVDVFSIITAGEKLQREKTVPAIVRAGERRQVKISSKPTNTIYESINYNKQNKVMDAYILTPQNQFSEKPMAHEGEELLFVLEGTQEFVYDGRSYVLEQGDCCCYDSNTPHYGRSLGEKPSKSLVVFTMKAEK